MLVAPSTRVIEQRPPLDRVCSHGGCFGRIHNALLLSNMMNFILCGKWKDDRERESLASATSTTHTGDDDTFNFSMRGLPSPASWLGSHSESAIAAMAGIVPSTNARFYAIVKPLYDELRPDSWLWMRAFSLYFSGFLVLDGSEVNFFSDGARNYVQNVTEALHSLVHFEASIIIQSRNPFVEYVVQYAIAVAYATLGNDNKELLQKLLSHGRDSLWFIRTTDRYLIID
ncbi:hypothetical protein Tco_0199056 [Tanacetum coccineum]